MVMWMMIKVTNDTNKADKWKENSLDGPVKLLNYPIFFHHLEKLH